MAKQKEIAQFKKKYQKEFASSENRNLLNGLTIELQKVWGAKSQTKYFDLLSRLSEIEYSIMPEIIEISKKYGKVKAFSEYEDLVYWSFFKDRRGIHRKKNFPSNNVLITEFETVKKKLTNGLKKHYRNPVAKKIKLIELFPEINQEFIEEYYHNPNRKIALSILSYKYDCSPLTLRNKLSNARKSLSKNSSIPS